MTDEQLQNMEPVELERFLEECVNEAENLGVTFEYYMAEFT